CEIGRAGEPDAHRMLDAEIAQPADPGEDSGRVEAELRDDVRPDAGRFGGRELVGQGAVELLLRQPQMALRIAGDADLHDAAALEKAPVNELDGAAQIACRLLA